MSREDLIETLGKPNEAYDHNIEGCTYSELHWYPAADAQGNVEGDGIFTFLKDGRAFELEFGEGFFTSSRVSLTTSFEELKKMREVSIYELTKSSSTATNNANLYFAIERGNGVAYEIAAGYRTKERVISGIYVFQPNSDFLPAGCIDANQKLVAIQ